MLNMKKTKVKVWWLDAVLYSRESSNKNDLMPTAMITEGVLLREEKDGIVIGAPKTILEKNRKSTQSKYKTFLFIPKGMIQKIEK